MAGLIALFDFIYYQVMCFSCADISETTQLEVYFCNRRRHSLAIKKNAVLTSSSHYCHY